MKTLLISLLLVSSAIAAPKYSSESGHSYTKPSTPSKPSSGSYTSGSRSYSGGTTVTKPPSSNKYNYGTTTSQPPKSSSHEYSSGSKKYSSGSTDTDKQKYSSSEKVNSGGWNEDLSSLGKQKDSQNAYNLPEIPPTPYVPPKYEYKTPAGKTKEYDSSDVSKVREKVDYEKYKEYDARNKKTFDKYSSQKSTTSYNDAINVLFWLWLLDQSLDTQAEWVYHHKNEIDELRYKEILQKTPGIDVKLAELEKSGVNKNPAYTPKSMENDADLQYNKDYVEHVIRPVDWEGIKNGLIIGLVAIICIVVVIVTIYFFAIKEF